MEQVAEDAPAISPEVAAYRSWQEGLIESDAFNKIIVTLSNAIESLDAPGSSEIANKMDTSRITYWGKCGGDDVVLGGKFDDDGVIEYVTLALNGCEFMVSVDVAEDDCGNNMDRVHVGSSGHIWAEADEPHDWSVEQLVNSAEHRAKVEQVFECVAGELGPF